MTRQHPPVILLWKATLADEGLAVQHRRSGDGRSEPVCAGGNAGSDVSEM